MIIDISLNNERLYKGCEIEEVGDRFNLKTPPSEAVNIIGRNAAREIEHINNKDEVTITGAAPIWIYLVVFHLVVHRFGIYQNGKGDKILIAVHG